MAVKGDRHICPVCGQIGPCIYAGWDDGDDYRVHNCHVCGSTWKEPKAVLDHPAKSTLEQKARQIA